MVNILKELREDMNSSADSIKKELEKKGGVKKN